MDFGRKQSVVWGFLLILFGTLGFLETYLNLDAWIWIIGLTVAGLGAYVFHIQEKKDISLLILSYVLLAIALLIALLTLDILSGPFVAAFILIAVATPFAFWYLKTDRKLWYLLIPIYALLAVALMIILIDFNILKGIVVAAYVNYAVAIPFFYVYFTDRTRWWALIPGGITALIATIFLMTSSIQFVGPAVLIILGAWLLLGQFKNKETE